jgi:hypothetical protein
MNQMHKKHQISYQNNLIFRRTFFIFKKLTEPESHSLITCCNYHIACYVFLSTLNYLPLKAPAIYTKAIIITTHNLQFIKVL